MVPYYGDFAEDATVYIPINTFDSNDPAASVTVTNLLNTDVHIHKDGGTTQRNNAAGITMSIDYDSITGNHLLAIDTNDNTVVDFWQAGHEYQVRIEGATVDAGTINAWVGAFSIERAGGALALLKNATYGLAQLVRSTTPANTLTVDANHEVTVPDTQKVDVETIKTQAITCGAGVTIRADVGAAAAPGAANGMLIGGTNAETTFGALTVTNATTLTGAVSLGSTLVITGATTFTGNVAMGGTFTVSGLASMTRGVEISNSLLNGAGVSITGNGTGKGLLITGGATDGGGVAIVGGATNSIGLYITGQGSGNGMRVDGGDGDGIGLIVNGGASNGSAVRFIGDGTGHGLHISSGDGVTGNGVHIATASTNGFGAYIVGSGTGGGFAAVGGAEGNGISGTGGGTSGHGLYAKAAGTGHGISANGGGIAGDGIHAEADQDGDGIEATGATNGDGLNANGAGTGEGISGTGGDTGHGIQGTGGATSGAGFYGLAQNNDDAGMELVANGTGTDLDADNIGVLTDAGVDAFWDRASSLTLSFETLLERAYQILNNKMIVTEASGDVALRNLADGADIATGNVQDLGATTQRDAWTW